MSPNAHAKEIWGCGSWKIKLKQKNKTKKEIRNKHHNEIYNSPYLPLLLMERLTRRVHNEVSAKKSIPYKIQEDGDAYKPRWLLESDLLSEINWIWLHIR